VRLVGEGLQRAAGTRLRHLLSTLTGNRFKALLVGAGVTAVLQSSSATTGEDRKSTRLNSSHVDISYAVYCLKKKIKDFLGLSRDATSTYGDDMVKNGVNMVDQTSTLRAEINDGLRAEVGADGALSPPFFGNG